MRISFIPLVFLLYNWLCWENAQLLYNVWYGFMLFVDVVTGHMNSQTTQRST